MSDPISGGHETVRAISARDRDADIKRLFPLEFLRRYEVHSYRNAAQILASTCKSEFDQIVGHLLTFQIKTKEIVASGGNKTQIARNIEALLHPDGWNETRIKGDLHIKKIVSYKEQRTISRGKNKGNVVIEGKTREELYVINGFIDGHKIDFVKGRVAFDFEWNSKDQTFDRDLYAVRTFYECAIVSAGVLLTRSAALAPLFAEIQNRVDIEKFKSKFGASTTWMKKLTYRLDAGRGGGCPILALGILPPVVSDFEDWKIGHPVKRQAEFDIDKPTDEAEEDEEN